MPVDVENDIRAINKTPAVILLNILFIVLFDGFDYFQSM